MSQFWSKGILSRDFRLWVIRSWTFVLVLGKFFSCSLSPFGENCSWWKIRVHLFPVRFGGIGSLRRSSGLSFLQKTSANGFFSDLKWKVKLDLSRRKHFFEKSVDMSVWRPGCDSIWFFFAFAIFRDAIYLYPLCITPLNIANIEWIFYSTYKTYNEILFLILRI